MKSSASLFFVCSDKALVTVLAKGKVAGVLLLSIPADSIDSSPAIEHAG